MINQGYGLRLHGVFSVLSVHKLQYITPVSTPRTPFCLLWLRSMTIAISQCQENTEMWLRLCDASADVCLRRQMLNQVHVFGLWQTPPQHQALFSWRQHDGERLCLLHALCASCHGCWLLHRVTPRACRLIVSRQTHASLLALLSLHGSSMPSLMSERIQHVKWCLFLKWLLRDV